MLSARTLPGRLNPLLVLAGVVGLAGVFVLLASGLSGLAVYLVATGLTVTGLRYPSVPIAAVVASIPLQTELTISLSGRSVTWTKIAVFAAVAAATIRFLTGEAKLKLPVIAYPFAAYVLVLIASAVNARDLDAWAAEVYRWSVA